MCKMYQQRNQLPFGVTISINPNMKGNQKTLLVLLAAAAALWYFNERQQQPETKTVDPNVTLPERATVNGIMFTRTRRRVGRAFKTA